MIDVDQFKQINDRFGHDVEDEALRLVAEIVRNTVRVGDLVGRWGGEEFLAILPSTDIGKAERVAERVRESVSSMPVVVGDQLVPVSVSIGAAASTGDECDALVAEADAAMYAAKASGRNAVRVAGSRRGWVQLGVQTVAPSRSAPANVALMWRVPRATRPAVLTLKRIMAGTPQAPDGGDRCADGAGRVLRS